MVNCKYLKQQCVYYEEAKNLILIIDNKKSIIFTRPPQGAGAREESVAGARFSE